jgi:AhpD family alkylhydroperoxidase
MLRRRLADRRAPARSGGRAPRGGRHFPADSIAAAWREEPDVEMSPSALPDKYKSLVGLAVAAQIPCRYCVVADTEFAKLSGATEREIGEAVAVAGYVRHTATMMVGLGVDEAGFKKDMDRIAHDIGKAMKTAEAKGAKSATAMTSTTK